MAVMSKAFEIYVRHNTCNALVHSGSCTSNAFHQLYRFFMSNLKYYFPIVAFPLVLKIHRLNAKVLKDTIRFYMLCVLGGSIIGWTTQTFICIFRNLFGEFKFYTFLFLPTILAGSHIFWESPQVQHLHMLSIYQATLETLIAKRNNFLSRIIKSSIGLQTFLFMCCSAVILNAKQIGAYKGFWFLKPNKRFSTSGDNNTEESSGAEEKGTRNSCTHEEENCLLHLLKGLRGYLAIGVTLDLITALRSKVPAGDNSLLSKLISKLSNYKLSTTALLTSYLVIYRLINCFLNRKSLFTHTTNHYIASFLGGSSYIFLPKLTILSFSLVVSLEILWRKFKTLESKNSNVNTVWNSVKILPIGKIVFLFCLADLVSTCGLRRNAVSNFAATIIDGTTNRYASNIAAKLKELEGFSKSY